MKSHRSACAAALLLVLCSCGGGDDGAPANANANVPANAAALESATSAGMKSAMGRLTAYEAALLFALDPGSPVTPNIVVGNDTSVGAAPFSVTFAGTVDGGFEEPAQTQVSGKATYASDPSATPFTSVSGQATIDVTLLGVLKVYHADVAYMVGATDRTLSGTGILQDPTTGNKTTMTIDPAKPLRMVPATGASANACGYVIEGAMLLSITGPEGVYGATYRFTATKPTVTVDSATYSDGGGITTSLPPIEVDLRCNYVIVDSVPEPETYALLMAGLGLLSWRGRRVVVGRTPGSQGSNNQS